MKDPALDLTPTEIYWIDAWNEFVEAMLLLRNGRRLPGFPLWADAWILPRNLRIPIGTPSWKRKALTYTTQKYSQQVCPYWVIQGRAILRSIKISNSSTLFLESCIKTHSKNRRERITFLLTNGPLEASFIDIFYLLFLFVFPKKCSSCGGVTRNV